MTENAGVWARLGSVLEAVDNGTTGVEQVDSGLADALPAGTLGVSAIDAARFDLSR